MEKKFNKLFNALEKIAEKDLFSVQFERVQHHDGSIEVVWRGYVANRGDWSREYDNANEVLEYFREAGKALKDEQTDPN